MYGKNSGQLRAALRELLQQHRIQHRIGGAGLHTVPETTTVAERQETGEQIARYRHAVLIWCHQAVRAARPSIDLARTTGRARGPAEELRYRLEASINADTATLPTLKELTTEQPYAMVETWRQAARACALGEHDFDAGVGYRRLSRAQSLTVVHDTAEVARALVGLDRRYARIPGWLPLKDAGRLGRAAEVCAAYSGYDDADYTVDRLGWKPAPTLIDCPGLPGITGVLQAQHNLLLHLRTFPNAKTLRVVVDSQRIVSLETARRLEPTDPGRATRWEYRAAVYGRLVHETRDLGGIAGNGGPAGGQAALAAARMQKLSATGLADALALRRLERISAGIDDRVCDAVEHGITKNLYFQRVAVQALTPEPDGHLTRRVHRRYVAVTTPVRDELLAITRRELRPVPVERKPPKGAAQSRRDLHDVLDHRPPPRGAPPDVPSI